MASTAFIGILIWFALGRPLLESGTWTTSNSFDLAKIVLSVAGGIGAVVALVVAYRRQHLSEAAERREDAKLFAERFTKAADQLGSDKAPVRLAGMYALEGLAQGASTQRQTIVNVLCAYLRMPYAPPDFSFSENLVDSAKVVSGGALTFGLGSVVGDNVTQATQSECEQERQVRLTAQRIIAAHLGARSGEALWEGVDLDLTGATLLDFNLAYCRVRTANFTGTTFVGATWFRGVEVDGYAWFGGAAFNGMAVFVGARFEGSANFSEAQFRDYVGFGEAKFGDVAFFDDVQFDAGVKFGGATFGEYVKFDQAIVRLDTSSTVERIWPDGYTVEVGEESSHPLGREGRWGNVVSIADSSES
ncbi:pentapeptide repeat-containing protein [Kutzneria sp. NPDC051319]|uniref:pentapeptide repeat-containing protein n=1 Tax=Kutzneria sp. NPDC051319 TaxID=3155047 RepID=UPI0034208942